MSELAGRLPSELHQALGQLFMLGFRGEALQPDHWLCRTLHNGHLGGVLLFDRNVDGSVQNISSPAQLRQLTADLQDAAGGNLLIAVDQEGGKVCRLKAMAGFVLQPAALDLAAAGLEASVAIRCRYGCRSNARNPMAATQPGERDRNSSAS